MTINRILFISASVILLIIIGLIIIFAGGGEEKPATDEEALQPLREYSNTNAEVSFNQRGDINGQDQHREILITISQFERRLDVISGYSGTIIKTQTFSNSLPAYRQFLAALGDSGFLLKRPTTDAGADPLGKCPLGTLYEFELNDGGDVLSYLWTSGCSNAKGTFAGSSSTVQQLFKNQITDYGELVSGVNL